jgi:hypothetical protein
MKQLERGKTFSWELREFREILLRKFSIFVVAFNERFPLKTKLLKIAINLSHFGHHCNPKQN